MPCILQKFALFKLYDPANPKIIIFLFSADAVSCRLARTTIQKDDDFWGCRAYWIHFPYASDGTTDTSASSDANEKPGYFVKASGGKNINFMVIERSAALQYQKHVVNKVVSPEENQTSDGWKFFYRSYGLCDVYENKVKGIYLHKSTT